MKLYYSRGACSLAVRIILHELNIACDFEAVDLRTKKTETGKDFLSINPKGVVPVLVTNDNQVLTENAAIQQYLADSNQATRLLPPKEDFKRYRVLEWLNFISSDLHKGCGALFNSQLSNDVKSAIFIPLLKKSLVFAEKSLGQKNYLMESEFTLPDAYLFVILSWLPHLGISLNDFPNLDHYFENLKKRESVQLSLKEEGFI